MLHRKRELLPDANISCKLICEALLFACCSVSATPKLLRSESVAKGLLADELEPAGLVVSVMRLVCGIIEFHLSCCISSSLSSEWTSSYTLW